jgi:tRNA pseudouridine13 synthase
MIDLLAARSLALVPPRAFGATVGSARLKSLAEDFRVDEQLGFAPDGGAAHCLLRVEKRDRDTLAVVRELARSAGVAPRDVGFAGLKDRRAVTTQWFTLPATRSCEAWLSAATEHWKVLEAHPHARKLRRGALASNRFVLRLRDPQVPDRAAFDARLELLARHGVPNYFGPQRFGRDGSNLLAIDRWLESGCLPPGRESRAFVYSAARSLLFNAVLAARVAAGTWQTLLAGERVNLAGRNSWFVAEEIDAVLEERLARHDIHPTGPLPGRGEGPGGEAGALEAAVLAPYERLLVALADEGLEASRRPLRVIPDNLEARWGEEGIEVAFSLPPGAYATVVMREWLDTDTPDLGGSDD